MSKGSALIRSIASSWLALGTGVVVSFFLSPFVVNKLGTAWYGIWAIAGTFTGYLYLLDFGVRESVIRYTSKYTARKQRHQLNRILTVALGIYTIVTVVTLALMALCVWGIPYWFNLDPQYWHDARLALVFVGLSIAQTFIFNVFTGVLIGLRRWELSNAMGIVINLVRAALIVFFLAEGYGIVALSAIQFGVAFVAGFVMMILALLRLRSAGMGFAIVPLPRRHAVALSRRVFGYGFYVLVNNVGEKVITATDAVLVGIFLPITSVAYYAVAGSLIGYLRQLVASTAQVFNPLASHLHALRAGAELRNVFLAGAKINMLITLPIAITYAILGQEFVGLWMGAEFAKPSGEVLLILALAQILAAPHYVMSSVLYGISRHRTIAILRVVEAAVNLTLCLTLVHWLGLVGIALGVAIPNAIIVIAALPILTCKLVGVSLPVYYSTVYARPLLAALPFAAAALWVREELPTTSLVTFFAQVAGLICVYLPAAFFVVLTQEERRSVFRRIGLGSAWA